MISQVVEGTLLPSKVFLLEVPSLLPRSFLPSTTETNEASGNGQESKNNQKDYKKMVTSSDTQVCGGDPQKICNSKMWNPPSLTIINIIIIPGE